MNKIRLAFVLFLGLFVVVVVIILLNKNQQQQSIKINSINSFEECSKLGYPILESYPRQCTLPGGKFFVESNITQECQKLEDCSEGKACINHTCQKLTK